MIEFTDKLGRMWVAKVTTPHYYVSNETGRDELLRLLKFVPEREFLELPIVSRLQHTNHSEV